MVINVTDNGYPQRWATIDAYIEITRDQYRPSFFGICSEKIKENIQPGARITTVRATDLDAQVSDVI